MSHLFVKGFILRIYTSSARVIINKLPGIDAAIFVDAGAYLNYSAGPEIGPRKFFLTGPNNFYRPVRFLCEACSLNSRFTTMLATKARAGVRHNYLDIFFVEPEGLSQFLLHSKGPLCACPH